MRARLLVLLVFAVAGANAATIVYPAASDATGPQLSFQLSCDESRCNKKYISGHLLWIESLLRAIATVTGTPDPSMKFRVIGPKKFKTLFPESSSGRNRGRVTANEGSAGVGWMSEFNGKSVKTDRGKLPRASLEVLVRLYASEMRRRADGYGQEFPSEEQVLGILEDARPIAKHSLDVDLLMALFGGGAK